MWRHSPSPSSGSPMARSYAPCLCPTHTMLLTLSIDSCEPKVRPEGCRMWWGERRRRWRSTSAWAPAPSSAPEPHPPPCRRAGVEYAVLDELIFPERLPNDQHFRCALGVAPLRSAPLRMVIWGHETGVSHLVTSFVCSSTHRTHDAQSLTHHTRKLRCRPRWLGAPTAAGSEARRATVALTAH